MMGMWEVGWVWVGVVVRGEGGGDCGTSLKMTKQVLATRELRSTEGCVVGDYQLFCDIGAQHTCACNRIPPCQWNTEHAQ